MGCDCSTPESRKDDGGGWGSGEHGTLIGISGGPCSGRSALTSLLVNNLDGAWTIRQEDYARGTRRDGKAGHVRCDPSNIDHAKLRKDVLIAARNYSFVIVEGRWCFQERPLVEMMSYKIHLDLDMQECQRRLVGKGRDQDDDAISQDMFDKWFVPYFQGPRGYIQTKLAPLCEKDDVLLFDANGGVGQVQEFAETTLAVILEHCAPAVHDETKKESGPSPRAGATHESAAASSSSSSATASGKAEWAPSGHGTQSAVTD